MATIVQSYGDVRSRMPWWVLGQLVEASSNDEKRDAINASPQATQVTSFVVTDPGDDTTVTVTIGPVGGTGVAVSVNTGTGLAAPAIAALLVAAIDAEPLVRGLVTPSLSTATITLTGRWPGRGFTVSATTPASIGSVTEVTAVDEADPIPFGRGVIRPVPGFQNTDELCALAKSSSLTAQVQTITVAYIASAVLNAKVYEVRGGEEYLLAEANTTSATDRDTTIDALVALLEARLPANTVAVTADNASATALVFTSEVAGLEFRAVITHTSGGASVPAISSANTTGPSEATSIHRALRGVTLRDQAVPAITVGGTEQQYPGNSVVGYLRRGLIAVESAEAITTGDTVYIELGVTADNGKFFKASSATRVALSRAVARWEIDADTNTGSLAALRLMM